MHRKCMLFLLLILDAFSEKFLYCNWHFQFILVLGSNVFLKLCNVMRIFKAHLFASALFFPKSVPTGFLRQSESHKNLPFSATKHGSTVLYQGMARLHIKVVGPTLAKLVVAHWVDDEMVTQVLCI